MLIKDVMTSTLTCCKPGDRLDVVARLMRDHACGELPVCDGTKLVGVITDRDITCRAVAAGKSPTAVRASEIMTRDVATVRKDDAIAEALETMDRRLVRRLPVVDDHGTLVGIVSQTDLMAQAATFRVARTMMSVSQKARKVVARANEPKVRMGDSRPGVISLDELPPDTQEPAPDENEQPPAPDHDVVEEIGEAIGLTYEEGEPLRFGEKEQERDEHRWELNPASAEDFARRATEEARDAEAVLKMKHRDQYKRAE